MSNVNEKTKGSEAVNESVVVHIVPTAVFSNSFHGSFKDTISRVRFLEKHAGNYVQIKVDSDKPDFVLSQLPASGAASFLIEYSTFPNIVKTLRKEYPQAFIAVRSHNLEPLQHFDNYGWWPSRGPLWMAYGMGRLLRNDLIVKKYTSAIWSISDWENRVYWDRLPGKAKVEWLPYHCPDHLLPEKMTPASERKRIVCLPTSQKNRKSWDLVTRFITFAENMKQRTGNQYEYMVTGNLSDWGLPETNAVQFTGMIDDLQSFLQTVRAVAMLSDKGYGFKTTIGDAIANGAAVLAHPGLARRCPEFLTGAILPVDLGNLPSTLNWLEEWSPDNSLNGKLRQTSEKMMTRLSEKVSIPC